MSGTLGIGIIGMGFMGQTHARSYLAAIEAGADAALIGVCDSDADRRAGLCAAAGNISTGEDERLFEPGTVDGHAGLDDLLADPRIGLVSVCTPTDTHAAIAERALRAGKHVLVEKPVALNAGSIRALADVAAGAHKLCIPAMCVRHWPGWSMLRSVIDSGEHGRVLHARFERLGSRPAWGGAFYHDAERCGGAAFDLHVHDADMVLWLFGRPAFVRAQGGRDHIETQYGYPGGPAVSAEGAWMRDPSFPFRMRFTVEFERAVLAFDSRLERPLSIHAGGEARSPDLGGDSGYGVQARAVIEAVRRHEAGEAPASVPTLGDAVDVTRLIDAELASAGSGEPAQIDW